jgi:O-antigen/teichoic acid export membrane protein
VSTGRSATESVGLRGEDATGAAAPSRRLARVRVVLRTGSWGIADQALISVTNFATMVLLARALTSSAFGSFVLVYTGLLFANSIQSALITQPHQILGAQRDRGDYERYTSSAAAQQVLLAGVFAGMALAGGGAAWLAGWSAAGLMLTLAPAVVAWQLQEFVRRVFYTEGRQVAACLNDVISYGGQLAGIVLLWRTDALTPMTALAVLAVTSAAAAVVGAWQLRSRIASSLQIRTHARENWTFGKWLLGSTLASWTSSQLYPLLTAGLVSVAATGALRAVQTVMGPTHILLKTLDTALPPTAARAYANGGARALSSLVGAIYWATAPLMLTYCLLVAIFSAPILDLLYGGRYNSYSWLLPLLALSYALVYLYTPVWIALRGQQISAPMFHAYLASTAVVLTLGIAAIYFIGVAGAGIGLITHGVIMNLFIWRSFRTSMAAAPLRTTAEEGGASRALISVSRVEP